MAALLENNSQTKAKLKDPANILAEAKSYLYFWAETHGSAFLARKASGPSLCMKCQGRIRKLTEKLQD